MILEVNCEKELKIGSIYWIEMGIKVVGSRTCLDDN